MQFIFIIYVKGQGDSFRFPRSNGISEFNKKITANIIDGDLLFELFFDSFGVADKCFVFNC